MRKLLQFTALFAITCCLFAGCDKTNDTGGSNGSITVSVDPIVLVGRDAQITVKTSRNMTSPLSVQIESDNAAVTTPKTIVIGEGKNSAIGLIKGVSVGSAKITITAVGFKYITRTVEITVKENTLDAPNLSIQAEANTTFIGSTVAFSISSTVAPTEDCTINLTCDKPELLTFPASMVLKRGKTVLNGEIQGKAAGDAVITITAEGAIIAQGTVAMKVEQPDLFASLSATGVLLNIPDATYFSFVSESNVHGKVYPGCLYAHDYDKAGGTSTGIKKSTIDYYGGSVVGAIADGEVFLKPVAEGTVINDDLAWQNYYTTYMRFPILVKEHDAVNSIPDGTHFIVLTLSVQGDPNKLPGGYNDAVYMPCWMKIKVEGMKIEVLDGAMVLDKKTPFKVGQK